MAASAKGKSGDDLGDVLKLVLRVLTGDASREPTLSFADVEAVKVRIVALIPRR